MQGDYKTQVYCLLTIHKMMSDEWCYVTFPHSDVNFGNFLYSNHEKVMALFKWITGYNTEIWLSPFYEGSTIISLRTTAPWVILEW